MRKSWQATNQSIETEIKLDLATPQIIRLMGEKSPPEGLKKIKNKKLVWPQGREEVVYLVWRYVDKSLSHLSQVI